MKVHFKYSIFSDECGHYVDTCTNVSFLITRDIFSVYFCRDLSSCPLNKGKLDLKQFSVGAQLSFCEAVSSVLLHH